MKTFKQLQEDLRKACWKGYTAIGMKNKNGRKVPNCVPVNELSTDALERYKEKAKNSAAQLSAAGKHKQATDRWMNIVRATGKQIKNTLTSEEIEELNERGANKYKRATEKGAGLTRAGVMMYRRKNPGSKLSTAVTTEPSKLKHGSKAWKRRKSFCARMSGMKGPMKDAKGRPTRKAMSLRRWHCHE